MPVGIYMEAKKKSEAAIRQWIHKQDVSQENIKYPFDRVTDAMNEMELPFKLEAGEQRKYYRWQ